MATLNTRGNSYVLTWSEGGKQYRRSLGSISADDAKAVLEIKQAELKHGFRIDNDQDQTTFGAFSREYLRWHRSEFPDSHFRVNQIITDHLAHFKHTTLLSIMPREVEAWKAMRLETGAAPTTVGKELRTLKAVLNLAVTWRVIPAHNIAGVREPKPLGDRPPPYYTTDELSAIYEAAFQYGALWRFVANTGMRRAEIMKAHKRDVVNGSIRILSDTQARTKSAKWRLVPLSPGALDALQELGGGYLAPQIHPRSLSRAFERDAERAGVGGSIHWLRHTFCSHLAMQGIGLRTIQELAGHASYQTTLKYSHLSAGHLADAVSGLSI